MPVTREPSDDQDWTSFDVHARDCAAAAHVAMWLREHLPAATIASAPDDALRQEILHCRAIPDRTPGETEQAVRTVLPALPDVAGPNAAAQVDFD